MNTHTAMNLMTRKAITIPCPSEECHETGHLFMEIYPFISLGFKLQKPRILQVKLCLQCGVNETRLLTKKQEAKREAERLEATAKRKDDWGTNDVL